MKHNQVIILTGILIFCIAAFSGCATTSTNTTSSATVSHLNETMVPAPITAQIGDNVSIIYTGTLDNGEVFDSNVNGTPVSFTLGNTSVIDGIQDAVTGMAVNEEKNVTIPYTKAYGPYRDELVHVIPLMGPLQNKSFTVGTYVTITNKTDNSSSVVKILNVTRDSVTWDENDPLAGQNLTFMIRVTDIGRK